MLSHYKRLAGEVESRNVQSRMDLDAESRKEKLLQETEDIAREDQIILFRALEQSNQELQATINIDGVERSTTNSEGKPIAQTEEGVRNFWEVVRRFKVVDAEGRPIVVYHATQSDFNEFKTQKIGTSVDFGTLGSGFYFTTSAENANNYARNLNTNTGKQGGESIMPVYLKINNPYDAQQLREVSGDSKKESENLTNKK